MNEGIKIAIDLQKQGMSLQKIVDKLNADGIPTVTGHGKWNKGTVSKQLKRHEQTLITDKRIQDVKEVLPDRHDNITVKQKEFENMTLQLQTYQQEIAERDAIIADLNMKLANSVPKNPNSFEGWTIVKNEKYVRLFKKFSGKNIGVYVGKEFDADIARRKIAEMTARLKTSVSLIPKRRGRKPKQNTSSLSAIPFETRLRVLCPDNKRTYRLDTLRKAFPDLSHDAFDREMLSLAGVHRIELLGGDPRECDPADLIKRDNILYVNFEWR